MTIPSRWRTGLVLLAVLLGLVATGARLAQAKSASTTPIDGAYYDNCHPHNDECIQVLTFPKQHHVSITANQVAGCDLLVQVPSPTTLHRDNSFQASGSTPKWPHHPVQHIHIGGRFVSPKKAHLTLTDCAGHKHHLVLPYRGLAGLGP
jgi:hypothetical protein